MPPSNIDPRRTEQLAYKLWEDAGRPDGTHEQHWRDAENLLSNEAEQAPPSPDLNGDVARLDGDTSPQTRRQPSSNRSR